MKCSPRTCRLEDVGFGAQTERQPLFVVQVQGVSSLRLRLKQENILHPGIVISELGDEQIAPFCCRSWVASPTCFSPQLCEQYRSTIRSRAYHLSRHAM